MIWGVCFYPEFFNHIVYYIFNIYKYMQQIKVEFTFFTSPMKSVLIFTYLSLCKSVWHNIEIDTTKTRKTQVSLTGKNLPYKSLFIPLLSIKSEKLSPFLVDGKSAQMTGLSLSTVISRMSFSVKY